MDQQINYNSSNDKLTMLETHDEFDFGTSISFH